MKILKKFKWFIFGGGWIILLGGFAVLAVFVMLLGASGSSEDCGDDSSTNPGTGASGGDWLKKGTPANSTAQSIYDHLTKTEGFGGAGASGALAIAKRESNFDVKAKNSGGGVAGWFQWSGWGNHVNGSRITSEGSIKAGDESTLTPENEFKLLHHELNGGYKKAKIKVGNAVDPVQAVDDWSLLYEGVSLDDPQTKPEQIHKDTQAAYVAFNGASTPPNSAIIGGDAGAEAGASNNDDSVGCSTEIDPDGIVGTAKQLIGFFTYEQIHGESNIGSVDNPDKNGVTDCSGFVWLVLKIAGYKVPDNMGWFTKSMEQDAKGSHKWLKEVDPEDAKAGDIVIVNTANGEGSNGHTAILEEDWKSGDDKDNTTKIIQMGGQGGKGGVNEGSFKLSFGSLLKKDYTITFAEPIKGGS